MQPHSEDERQRRDSERRPVDPARYEVNSLTIHITDCSSAVIARAL